ncbi:hypothetical protein Psi02_78700 [Planotetraspora silvatica]|uniref:LysR substrate-binding domain-containing protein n=1 Tax=Planotetraspora silvatica TaxID=234614 RepID=A0A8J3UVC7_9ACTN|nr:hypothetical protein [Planotetraspora silvatica]GII51446.1 hypothetical protein Psi02_78700 [Planotetraspora silvatica]
MAVKPVPDYWFDRYVPELTPKGRPIDRADPVGSIQDIFMYTALGDTVSLFPVHGSRYYSRPDIVYLPVTDMGALEYGLVWRSEAENDLIRAFARVVRDLGPLPD